MKFTGYLGLALLLALVLVPTAVKADGWGEGTCSSVVNGESTNSGRVGSTASITIDGGSRPVDGPYQVRWSKKSITEENADLAVLARGIVPSRETKVTVAFTIPEATYGTNYVQFLREWRPEVPYGFAFTVLPGITVSPSAVSPGAKVTINGTGFPANDKQIQLSLDGKDTKLAISSNGVGSFNADFDFPNTIAGRHEFKVTLENISIGDVSVNFQVRPTIDLEPEHPEVGKEVTVIGRGFASTSKVSIKYDDITISSSPTTNDSGNFSQKFTVPESSKDDHVITATDKAGNVATSGLPLESQAPPAPNLIYPCNGQRFGWFGPQLVNFKWEEVSDPSGVTYTIEVGQNTKVWPPTATKAGLTKTAYAIKLEPGTYYWQVRAIDGAGNESDAALAPYPFKVGLFSAWYLVLGSIFFLLIFILIVRAFFRRVSEYYT